MLLCIQRKREKESNWLLGGIAVLFRDDISWMVIEIAFISSSYVKHTAGDATAASELSILRLVLVTLATETGLEFICMP